MVLVGSKVVLVVGFCGTFRGFLENVVVLVASRFICGTSSAL